MLFLFRISLKYTRNGYSSFFNKKAYLHRPQNDGLYVKVVNITTQSAITCSKSTIETLEQNKKYV